MTKRLEGKTVLTQGTGCVSCAAIQIASALGATVITTSSSDTKLRLAQKLGATYLINYKTTPAWDEEVLRITEGKGVDHVIEIGGAQTLLKSVNSTRPGGLVSLIGILSEAEELPKEIVQSLLFSGRVLKGCVAFMRDGTEEYARFVEANGIEPVVAEVFAFGDVREAFGALEGKEKVGKIVVRIAEE
ncbi:hypothetical protein BU23DRAFT_655523 [Bimuria novae-zelandiae CBS 107.79]|uniref:Alcohol dehydrogenase-like C-terminal domain-containing protein n=1 Tax=Bimuria novae-zelandiae CBS 107.79 TaxID=1447943 RepID=A0A6A5V0Y7_9PLEO|nr:hypothetical protein BU23DRAFT_655523 [Bimuria novae-zelandiae CBS 107.79]